MPKLPPHATPQPGTWYFDRWTRRHVKMVFGAQAQGSVTVEDRDCVVVVPVSHLDLARYWTPSGQHPAVPRDKCDTPECWEPVAYEEFHCKGCLAILASLDA